MNQDACKCLAIWVMRITGFTESLSYAQISFQFFDYQFNNQNRTNYPLEKVDIPCNGKKFSNLSINLNLSR